MSRESRQTDRPAATPPVAIEPYSLPPKLAAIYIGVPETTLRDAMRRGEIGFRTYGKGAHKARYILRVADLRAWVDRGRRPARWEGAE